jgi:acetate kinase
MHILTFKPTLRSLSLAAFRPGTDEAAVESTLDIQQFDRSVSLYPAAVFDRVNEVLDEAGVPLPDAIGVRALFGGECFPRPVFVSDQVLAGLESLAPQAPLHVPGVIELAKSLRSALPDTPVVLAFETSFFVGLPARERWYGLDPEMMASQALRRYGYHGLYHDGACIDVTRRLAARPPRILSVCLEPRPELAACLGRRPVMVTGGNTPIEGLPGETTCGDLDPSVVLKLAHDTHWGPEQTSRVLSAESGLRGVVGRPITLAELVADSGTELELARELFLHSLLRACGAGIAALGGVDAIVYSGRYAPSGAAVQTWLGPHLRRATREETPHFVHARTWCQHLGDIVRVLTREGCGASA